MIFFDPSIIAAFISGVVGPSILLFLSKKMTKKKDLLSQELIVSNIIQDKLLELQKTINSDRIWITQFHNGGHFYPTGKSIQKFSMIYEIVSQNTPPLQTNFQNIPINLFSKSIKHILENDIMVIEDFDNDLNPTYGLKHLAQETGCKSEYGFALKTLNGRFIGIIGIDFNKNKRKLTEAELDKIQYLTAAIGGLLGDHLFNVSN